MCCGSPDWKREVVQDHKFDFIDVRDYHDSGCLSWLQYSWLYLIVIKSFGVYIADLYTAISMLASNHWAGSILQNTGDSTAAKVPFSIGKWIFTGCIIFSFLLLAWEGRKARAIIRSRDISYSYTNVMANNYYCLKSYDHFCFFNQINNSKKKKDEFAFFIFFTFKGWKRLILADAPRQVINGLTLYSFGKANHFTTDVSKYYEGSWLKAGVLITMIFTVLVFVGSAILLAIAAIMYVPLLCYIQGNLKEYCCHKVDKRISELVKRKMRKRLAAEAEIAKKEARGDFSHLKDKKGKLNGPIPQQPTLPKLDSDDYGDSKSDIGSAVHMYPPQTFGTARGLAYPQQPWAANGYGGGGGGGYEYEKNGYNGGYAASDVGSIRGDRAGYEGSITSLEPLTKRPGPGGGYHSHSDSMHSGGDHGYGAGPGASSASLGRAPTYRSQENGGGAGGGGGGYGAEGSIPPMPDNAQYNAYVAQQQQYGGGGQNGYGEERGYVGQEHGAGSHGQQATSSSQVREEYQAPGAASKAALLERTAGGKTLSVADSVSELGYWRENDEHPTSGQAMATQSDQHRRAYDQPHIAYDQPHLAYDQQQQHLAYDQQQHLAYDPYARSQTPLGQHQYPSQQQVYARSQTPVGQHPSQQAYANQGYPNGTAHDLYGQGWDQSASGGGHPGQDANGYGGGYNHSQQQGGWAR